MAVEELREKSKSTTILITRNGMGECEKELQQILINLYFMLLQEKEMLPGSICFYADGVKLVVENSPVLGVLQELEQKGVRLIICMTCLKYFGLEDKVKVGTVGGMHDIILAQWMADKVITL
jgi:intracellular sulfur oxidation DsrE/DsrF family protein